MEALKQYLDESVQMQESILNIEDVEAQLDNAALKNLFGEIQNMLPIEKDGCDCCGRKLEEGDWVVFIPTGAKDQGFQCGMVMSVKKRIRIATLPHWGGWQSRYNAKLYGNGQLTDSVLPGYRTLKIEDPVNFFHGLV